MKDDVDILESIVQIKEAEAWMIQSLANDALGEVGSLRRLTRPKNEILEEESSEWPSKLCLLKTEKRSWKKLEELKSLENLHCDYNEMKMQLHMEISGLLSRKEAAKQPLI